MDLLLGMGLYVLQLPIDLNGLIMILDFRLAIGNGPDFCFWFCSASPYVSWPCAHLGTLLTMS